MNKNIISIILICSIIAFLVACASEGGPSGGPEDKVGPGFISSYPVDGEVNVSRTPQIVFTFDEPIDYRTIDNTLKIFPDLPEKPKIKVSKNEVKIIPIDSLEENMTYIFSFGRSLQDFQKNKTDQEIRLAFSTGNEIDNSSISGQVSGTFDEKKPISILLYHSNDTFSDSIIFQKPQYMTTINKYGAFHASNLAIGNYRIYALEGGYEDFLRVSDNDQIGLPTSTHESITTKSDTITGISLSLNKYFLKQFRLINCKQKDGFIELNLSYPITENALTNSTIFIDGLELTTNYWIDDNESQIIKIHLQGKDSCLYKIDIQNLVDLEGRVLKHSTDSLIWLNDEIIDTTGASLRAMLPRENKSFPLDSDVIFDFSEPIIHNTNISDDIQFFDQDSNIVTYKANWIDANTLIVDPENLTPSMNYSLKLSVSKWEDFFNNAFRDSIITYKFRTVNPDTFGIISGTISSDDYYVTKLKIGCSRKGKSEVLRVVQPDSFGSFRINNLMPEDYKLFSWYDIDENNEYNKGKLIPFELPEKRIFYTDIITVRSRWETEEVQLKF